MFIALLHATDLCSFSWGHSDPQGNFLAVWWAPSTNSTTFNPFRVASDEVLWKQSKCIIKLFSSVQICDLTGLNFYKLRNINVLAIFAMDWIVAGLVVSTASIMVPNPLIQDVTSFVPLLRRTRQCRLSLRTWLFIILGSVIRTNKVNPMLVAVSFLFRTTIWIRISLDVPR